MKILPEFELALLLRCYLNDGDLRLKFLRTDKSPGIGLSDLVNYIDHLIAEYGFKLELEYYDKAYQALQAIDRNKLKMDRLGQTVKPTTGILQEGNWAVIPSTGKQFSYGVWLLEQLGHDNTLADDIDIRLRSWQVVTAGAQNYQQRKPLLAGIVEDKKLFSYIQRRLGITLVGDSATKDKINKFLFQYMSAYNGDNLDGGPVYDYQRHIKRLLELFNHQDILTDGHRDIFRKDIAAIANPTNGQVTNDTAWRFLEFLLRLEQDKILRIKDLQFEQEAIFQDPALADWKLTVKLLRKTTEIMTLNDDWLYFGQLGLHKRSGTVRLGHITKVWSKSSQEFRLLQAFLQKPGQDISVKKIHKILDPDTAFNDQEAAIKQTTLKIKKLIQNKIRKPLQLHRKNSRLDIFQNEDSFCLTALPA